MSTVAPLAGYAEHRSSHGAPYSRHFFSLFDEPKRSSSMTGTSTSKCATSGRTSRHTCQLWLDLD